MKKISFILALAALSACNSEENLPSNESVIRLTSEVTPMSRGTNLNQQSTQIVNGQKVGVTITGAKSEHNNVAWTVGNNGEMTNTGDPVYWGDGDATITSYHPYNAGWGETDVTFSVNTDQRTDNGYLNSDLLWSTKTASKSTDAIALTFNHKLAKINITLTSTDIADLSNATISICNTRINTGFNPITGELSAASTAMSSTIIAGVTTTEAKTASAIIIPQIVTAGTKFIQIEHLGKIYYYTLPTDKEFVSGNAYSFTLNVKEAPTELQMISNSITAWDNENITGESNEDETVFTYSTIAEEPTKNSDGIYQIASASNLKWFMENVTSSDDINSASFLLTTDITFEGLGWKTISYFKGTFDGGNHIINNAKFGFSNGYAAFIGRTTGDNAVVKNLILNNPEVSITYDDDYYKTYGGALIAVVGAGTTIQNCGVVGGEIYANDTSRAKARAGGLIGSLGGTWKPENITIKGCYVSGTLFTGSATYMGGLIGEIDSSGKNIKITSCYTKDLNKKEGYGAPTMSSFIDSVTLDGESNLSSLKSCYYNNTEPPIGALSSNYDFETSEITAFTNDNFASVIATMNANLTDCDYIFGTDGTFVKR